MKAILPNGRQPALRRCVSPVIGVLLVCVLALFALQLKETMLAGSNAGAELTATRSSRPSDLAKKPLRYEAIINNWKRYRSSETRPTEIATKISRAGER